LRCSGLPDISKPKIPIWVNFEALAIEDVRIFYGRLIYFTAIWHILWPFGIIGIYSCFWYVVPRKIWQPWCQWQNYRHPSRLISHEIKSHGMKISPKR
jgi:hypothetical protein